MNNTFFHSDDLFCWENLAYFNFTFVVEESRSWLEQVKQETVNNIKVLNLEQWKLKKRLKKLRQNKEATGRPLHNNSRRWWVYKEQTTQRKEADPCSTNSENDKNHTASRWYCHAVPQPGSNVLIMRASFEPDNLVPIVQHAKHIPSPHLPLSVFSPPRACTIVVWWGLNDWRRNEVKRERITVKKERKQQRKRGWWWEEHSEGERAEKRCGDATDSMQLQLGERFCAREYVNSSFVWAVDWPLLLTRQRGKGKLWAWMPLFGMTLVTGLIWLHHHCQGHFKIQQNACQDKESAVLHQQIHMSSFV